MKKYYISPETVKTDKRIKLSGIKTGIFESGIFETEKLGYVVSSNCKSDEKGVIYQDQIKDLPAVTKIYQKKAGWVRLKDENDDPKGYVLAVTKKKSFFGLLGIIILAVLIALLSILSGVFPKDLPLYYADQAGITDNNKDAKAVISGYASYQSVPDQTWKADSNVQSITLAMPETVTKTIEKNGKKKTVSGKNPVMASPHIYVDFNRDGKYQEKECIYNPMNKDKNGNVIDYGKFITPGHEVQKIRLTKSISICMRGEPSSAYLLRGF